ncbi:MAG TPA: branched-chain amino acid ABC transporter permease [Dehalococcoidales bacterium]
MSFILSKLTPGYLASLIIVILLAIMPVAGLPQSWTLYLLLFFIYLPMANMWNLVAGYTGMISLAQPAFLGLAGYTLAITSWVHVPWWGGLLGGAAVAGIFAFLMSLAVFKLSGVYFAIGTLVVPEALRIIFYQWKPVGGVLSGGGAGYNVKGLTGVTMTDIYWLALLVAVVSAIIVHIVLKSNLGLGIAAIRDNQRAAASAGVNTYRIKLYPFIIGAIFTGLAGGIFFIYQPFIEPVSIFNVKWTMIILLATVIGGLRTEGGPIIGTIIYVFLYFLLSGYGDYSILIQGVILLVIMLLSPQGIVGIAKKAPFFETVLRFFERPLRPAESSLTNKTSPMD